MGIWKRVALKLARQRSGLMTACGFGEYNLQTLGAAHEALQVEYDELVGEFNELVDDFDKVHWITKSAHSEAAAFRMISILLAAVLAANVVIAIATH